MWQYILKALAGILSFVLDILPIGGFLKKTFKNVQKWVLYI